ncbi:hypothetical protein N7540_003216 [Penicillium herquei]|nr:hypothetical protein N7540_003216 [Penicillium herquei]
MQLIGFVKDGVHVCKSIYETGSLDPNLAETTEYLAKGLGKLEVSLGQFRPLNADEQELVDIAQGSLVTARELKGELEKISSGSSKGKHAAAFKGWLRAVLGGKKRIEKLEKVMRDRQQILESRLLLRVWYVSIIYPRNEYHSQKFYSNKNDALHIQQNEGFDRLETVFRSFIEARALDQTALKQLICSESTAMKMHIDKRTESLVISMQKLSIHEKLLGSLKHGAMNSRRNLIKENHENTLSWIFQGDEEKTENNNKVDFVEWLCHPNNRIYWISGKAGSGKSVLMKLLIDHPFTQSTLDDSNGGTLILSHFFWAGGQTLERNLQGTLLSLIYQLLSKSPDLCDLILERFPRAKQKDFPIDWSNEELRDIFLRVSPSFGKHICLFLDGIDEIDANEKEQLFSTILKDLSSIPRLQICVSGRPEPEVQMHFGSCPQLHVQDLTRLDIEKYARDNLKELHVKDAKTIERLITRICEKASGVFLWVALALKSIRTGYSNHDDPAELEERLRLLPSDLNTLYQQMWHRLNDNEVIYRKTAAQYFNFTLECIKSGYLFQPPGILLLALAINPELAIKVLKNGDDSLLEELYMECEKILVRLPIRCAGILEITKEGEVTLLHRSAQEFLTNTLEGQIIREADQVPSEIRLFNLAQGLLTCIRVTTEFKIQNSSRMTSRVLEVCKWADKHPPEAGMILQHSYTNFIVRNRLSSARLTEFLSLAESLYATGHWIFDIAYSLHPDFLGAITQSGFFQQALNQLAKLCSDAPDGMMISDLYKLYIFSCAVESLSSRGIGNIADAVALISSFKTKRKEIDNQLHCSVNIFQSFELAATEAPPFFITSDPLAHLLGRSLDKDCEIDLSDCHDLVIRILKEGYNLFTKTVILLETRSSNPRVIHLFEREYCRDYKYLPDGSLFIEVNTKFLLTMYVQLLENQREYISTIIDLKILGELKKVVSNMRASASARLLAFTPLVAENSNDTRSTDEDSDSMSMEKFSNDNHHEGEYIEDENPKDDDSDSGHDESDDGRGSDLDGESYSSDCERWVWASSADVLVPLNKADSDFVLDSIFGNISARFEHPDEGSFYLFEALEIPELESRLQQISLKARLSTVLELEETLEEAGFLVAWNVCPDVWPPSVYEPEFDDEEIQSQSSVLENFLKW